MKVAFIPIRSAFCHSVSLFSCIYEYTLSKSFYQVRLVSNVKVQKSKMGRVLNVAEKNDAAKSLAEIMSRGGARRVNINTNATFQSFKF